MNIAKLRIEVTVYVVGSYIDMLVPYVLIELGSNYRIMHVGFIAGLLVAWLNGVSLVVLRFNQSSLQFWRIISDCAVVCIHMACATYVSNHRFSSGLFDYYGVGAIIFALVVYNGCLKLPFLIVLARRRWSQKSESLF